MSERRHCHRLFWLIFLLILACYSVAFGAAADHDGLSASQGATRIVRIRRFGPLLDFAAPRAGTISAFAGPIQWLGQRLRASGNFSHGMVNFVPFEYLSPTLTLEGGSLFELDPQRLATPLGVGFGAFERLGYDFGDAHLGFELCCPRLFRLLFRGGFSMLVAKPDGFDDARTVSDSSERKKLGASARLLLQIPI